MPEKKIALSEEEIEYLLKILAEKQKWSISPLDQGKKSEYKEMIDRLTPKIIKKLEA